MNDQHDNSADDLDMLKQVEAELDNKPEAKDAETKGDCPQHPPYGVVPTGPDGTFTDEELDQILAGAIATAKETSELPSVKGTGELPMTELHLPTQFIQSERMMAKLNAGLAALGGIHISPEELPAMVFATLRDQMKLIQVFLDNADLSLPSHNGILSKLLMEAVRVADSYTERLKGMYVKAAVGGLCDAEDRLLNGGDEMFTLKGVLSNNAERLNTMLEGDAACERLKKALDKTREVEAGLPPMVRGIDIMIHRGIHDGKIGETFLEVLKAMGGGTKKEDQDDGKKE